MIRPFASLVTVSLLCSVFHAPARADGCVEIWARGLKDPGGETARRTSFKGDERAVVCIRLGQPMFVSVWDTPPRSNPTRLFPNRFTSPDDRNALAARVEANRTICFGDASSFPLFFDKSDGLGPGRLSVVATERLEDQFASDDFVIPGSQVTRSALETKERSMTFSARCTGKMRDEFRYRITN